MSECTIRPKDEPSNQENRPIQRYPTTNARKVKLGAHVALARIAEKDIHKRLSMPRLSGIGTPDG